MVPRQALVVIMIICSLAAPSDLPARSVARVEVLPPPQTTGGMPLMDALAARRSTRTFETTALDGRTLSDLLWAAAGVNRPDEGKRTAPSARNQQAIDLYVARADGLWRYVPKHHMLRFVADGDLRALTGTQDFVARVPVNLIYVLDERRTKTDGAAVELYAGADTAFMAENVYLYCASAGLGTVVRGSVDKAALAKAMGLDARQRVVLCQSVGRPTGEGR